MLGMSSKALIVSLVILGSANAFIPASRHAGVTIPGNKRTTSKVARPVNNDVFRNSWIHLHRATNVAGDSQILAEGRMESNVDKNLAEEVEEALRKADLALMAVAPETTPPPKQAKKTPAPKAVSTAVNLADTAAASLGGAILGFIFGLGVDFFLAQDLSFSFKLFSLDALVLPSILGTLFAALTLIIVRQDSAAAEIFGKILASGPKRIGKAMSKTIQNGADRARAIPGRIRDSIKRRVTAIPQQVAMVTKEVTTAVVEEIKATPGRVAESTKTAVVTTVDNTKKAIVNKIDDTKSAVVNSVNKAVSLPAEKVKEISETVFNAIPETPKVKLPKPPKTAPSLQQIKRQTQQAFLNVEKSEKFA